MLLTILATSSYATVCNSLITIFLAKEHFTCLAAMIASDLVILIQ
jgi:hypothetical protein